MMTLDERAKQASDAVKGSVAEYAPRAGFATVAARQRRARFASATLAGGLAVLVLLVGAWLRGPAPEPDVAVTTTDPDVTTTLVVVDERTPIDSAPGPDQIGPEDGVVDADPGPVVAPPAPPVGDPEPTEPVETPPVSEPPTVEPVQPEDTTPPPLVITSPTDGSTVTQKRVVFEGTTEPGARVFAGRFEATVTPRGKWSIRLVLQEGVNGARFTARDEAGNETTRRIKVVYEPEDKEEPPPPVDWDFTAFATFGSCSEDPPYDVYYGTAEPGTTVTIASEYGGSTVVANGEGRWEKKVVFGEAPLGEVFLVTIKDKHGTKKKFEFVANEPG